MDKNLLYIEANTPEEVEQALEAVQDKKGARYAALSIAGPKVIIQQFNVPRLALKGLKRTLQLEAAGLLSLAPDDVSLDYHIAESTKDKLKGFFLAAPLELVQDYCAHLSQARLIPVAVSVHILRVLDSVMAKDASFKTKSFSLVYFNKRHNINLVVFANGNCELIREILFDNSEEAKRGIISSIRYASGKASSKERKEIYCTGDIENNKSLISELEEELNCKIGRIESLEVSDNSCKNCIGINLIKEQSLALDLRQWIWFGLNSLLVVAFFLCAWPVNKLIKTEALKKNLSASLKAGDYERAKSLQEKIKKNMP